jgi:SAM-dependent methyltransferase
MVNEVKQLSGPGASKGWRGFAGVYGNLGPPLVPGEEDCKFLERTISDWISCHPGERLRALMLGVTPALVGISWPASSFLTAVDRSHSMIQSIWPGNIDSCRGAAQGDWLALPIRNGSLDMVLGDGSLIAMRYPDGFRTLCRAIRNALRTGGVAVLRVFVRPPVQDDPADVIADLPSNATFHQFKLRLLMAMQPSPEEGAQLDRVHRYWTACNIDRTALELETGWRREEIDTIDRYLGLDDVYTFPTLQELLALLGEFFPEISVRAPSYPLGERFPTLVMRP